MDKDDKVAARKALAKYGLEGEQPTCFFCKMNRKMRIKAQFNSLLVKGKDDKGNVKERSITDQKKIKWEVRKFYWSLYRR